MCFLSGLTGQEILMFVDAYLDAGKELVCNYFCHIRCLYSCLQYYLLSNWTEMEPVVFAAMMPNNAQKPIEQLLEEILDDHNRLVVC